MSQEHIDIWTQAADAFDARYNAITADQWEAETPCDGWCVKDLVEHAVGTQAGMIAPMLGIEVAPDAEWPVVRDAMKAGLTPEAMEGTTEFGPMGTVPKMVPVGIATSDILIHAWDLARAIGADETLPAAAVTATLNGLKRFPPEMMRSEGMFNNVVEVAADADEQTQMIAFAGRQP